MSDSGSLCSNSSSSLEPEVELECRRPRKLRGRKSLSSSSSSRESSAASQDLLQTASEDTPSKESISAALDKYVSASREGREAFNTGNLRDAVKEFNQALDIELQTELECLYDTSIGMVSGLVRREVDSRLDMQGKYVQTMDEKCSRILDQLKEVYEEGCNGVKGKKSGNPEWYLKMGAALIVVNEWEKAKTVYTEGISACKDKKKLKSALKDLIKIEQMTSYAEIPAEDQPDFKDTLVPPSPKNSPAPSPSHSPHLERLRSGSLETTALRQVKQHHTRIRGRTSSLSLEVPQEKGKGHNRTSTSPSPVHLPRGSSSPVLAKKDKRLSFSRFTLRRPSSGSIRTSSTSTTPEEVQEWIDCFEPSMCKVLSQTGLQPSAITHMRRLASTGGEDDTVQTDLDSIKLNSISYTAVVQQSMVIEDDDSELDDTDD